MKVWSIGNIFDDYVWRVWLCSFDSMKLCREILNDSLVKAGGQMMRRLSIGVAVVGNLGVDCCRRAGSAGESRQSAKTESQHQPAQPLAMAAMASALAAVAAKRIHGNVRRRKRRRLAGGGILAKAASLKL